MLFDYEQELTVAGGHPYFNVGTEYGAEPYDLKNADDVAIGEPLEAFYQVLEDFDSAGGTLTLDIQLVASSTGASGGTETALCSTGATAEASMAAGSPVRLGIIPPGLIDQQYIVPKLVIAGENGTAGKVKVWLMKGDDMVPANVANTF